MSIIVLDAGNSIIKAKIARREQGELAFPYAVKLLTSPNYHLLRRWHGLEPLTFLGQQVEITRDDTCLVQV